MITVSNKKIIHRIARKSLKVNRLRNVFAIIAITLTTVLFTALFTTLFSLNYSWQQETMRQMGGNAMGAFKNVTLEQIKMLSKDPLIKDWGYSRILAFPWEGAFQKNPTEVRYFTEQEAKNYFSYPEVGTMPKERLDIVMDTQLLNAMGIEPKIGTPVTLKIPIGEKGQKGTKVITETFNLCGYYEKTTLVAHEILLSKQYVDEMLLQYKPEGNNIGKYNMSVNFKNSFGIEEKLNQVLENYGYQSSDPTKDNYIDIGVSWAHTSSNIQGDPSVYVGITVLLCLIILTGYLIIYNIFQISITNDIRFYGLLKTIGTTGKQLKRMIRHQVWILCGIGIPIGLLIGFGFGAIVVPMIMENMSVNGAYLATNPIIFFCSTIFSILTVLLSLRKPAKVVSKVSPVEAVRYTESKTVKKKKRSYQKGNRLLRMAVSNLARTKKKTVLIILSLSLSCILICITYVFAVGFDMNKFIKRFVISDFYVASANYFLPTIGYYAEEDQLTQEILDDIRSQEGVQEMGMIRLSKEQYISIDEQVTNYYKKYPMVYSENLQYYNDVNGDGKQDVDVKFYGLDSFCFDQLKLLEGSLDRKELSKENAIVYLVNEDDYGKPEPLEQVLHVGDKVMVTTLDDYEYVKKKDDLASWELKVKRSHEKEYEIVAVACMNPNMTDRFFGTMQFALPTDRFIEDTGETRVMSCMIKAKQEDLNSLETFFKQYTEITNPSLDYESRFRMEEEFFSFRNMFLNIGMMLSITIGMIGTMNYINGILTSIIARKREFAIMRSVGMTGRQLKSMLIMEGIFYSVMTLFVSIVISVLIEFSILQSLGQILWFLTPKFTLFPFIILIPLFVILGVMIPILSYKATNRVTIVEQLRNYES